MSNIAEQLQQTVAKGLPHKELIDKYVEFHRPAHSEFGIQIQIDSRRDDQRCQRTANHRSSEEISRRR